MVAAEEHAATGTGFHDDLGPIDMTCNDVDALVGEGVRGFRFLDGERPFTGEDDLAGDRGIDGAGAEQEGVDVEQDLRNGLCGDEADLLGLGHVTGNDAVQVLAHADIAEIGTGIGGLVRGPEAAAMLEADIGISRRHGQDMWVEIAEGGREEQRGTVEVDHALHGLLDVDRFRHLLFFDHRHALDRLDRGSAFGMSLVIAEVILRADIDEADGQTCGAGDIERKHAACGGKACEAG